MLNLLQRLSHLSRDVSTLLLSHVSLRRIEARDVQLTRTPGPISINPDQNWDGIDGSWSSFTLRIGTPPQYVRTFVSWNSYQTWAVIPAGCNTSANYAECADSRGWIFDNAKSKTFDEIGLYDLSIEENLGYQGNAIYGYDTVGLGGAGEEGPTLNHTIVGGMAWPDFYLGVFGLNPKPTNFTSFNDPSTSYMTLLREQKYIPSVSFGYTAGSKYRYTGELASLTLGGYDSSKLIDNDVSFAFASDNSRDIVVALQSVTTPSKIEASPNPTLLLPSPIYAYVDATVAEIWLPIEACEVFEYEFGLVYDNTTELYLVNNTLHQHLLNRNPTITFTLGTELSGGKTVSIELPYAAFDLTAKPPYRSVAQQSYYFPLRRAVNDTQYTIGRTFFQEAYISIDYESQKFNISQRLWDPKAESNIIAIPPYPGSEGGQYPGVSSGAGSSEGLEGGIIAVIAVGAAVLLGVVGVVSFLFFRRRKSPKKQDEHEELDSEAGSTRHATAGPVMAQVERNVVYNKPELVGSSPVIQPQPDSEQMQDSRDVSSSGVQTPRTPHSHSGSTFPGFMYVASPSTEGTGTQSSSSASNGADTITSGVPPTHNVETVHEMVGDMPIVREKDGKELSEKEALAHREKVYNGVEPPASFPLEDSGTIEETPLQVNVEHVVAGGPIRSLDWYISEGRCRQHRAFSFDEDRLDEDYFSRDKNSSS